MDAWFSETGVGLSAEHGCFYRHPSKLGPYFGREEGDEQLVNQPPLPLKPIPQPLKLQVPSPEAVLILQKTASNDSNNSFIKKSSSGWFALVDEVDPSYRSTIRPLLQHYTDRTPGSFIEEKDINMTWHYRDADPEFGSWQASELQVNLEKLLAHAAVSVNFSAKKKPKSSPIFLIEFHIRLFLETKP